MLHYFILKHFLGHFHYLKCRIGTCSSCQIEVLRATESRDVVRIICTRYFSKHSTIAVFMKQDCQLFPLVNQKVGGKKREIFILQLAKVLLTFPPCKVFHVIIEMRKSVHIRIRLENIFKNKFYLSCNGSLFVSYSEYSLKGILFTFGFNSGGL